MSNEAATAWEWARDIADRRAQKRAHRAALRTMEREQADLVAEWSEAWQKVAPSMDEDAEVTREQCGQIFQSMGMRAFDLRGRLPGAPAVLRNLACGGDWLNFATFCQVAHARMGTGYDGPVCALCCSKEAQDSHEPSFVGRLECAHEPGACCVFHGAMPAPASDSADVSEDARRASLDGALDGAVLTCFCFQEGICLDLDPRLGGGVEGGEVPPALRQRAARVATATRARLAESGAAYGTVAGLQAAVEEALLSQ